MPEDGWGPLCKFLEKDIAKGEHPRANWGGGGIRSGFNNSTFWWMPSEVVKGAMALWLRVVVGVVGWVAFSMMCQISILLGAYT